MPDTRGIIAELRKLEKRRRGLMDVLLETGELAVGTVRRAKRPCGNPRCGKCAISPSHEQVVFYYTTGDGKRTSTFVRHAEEERFEQAGERYAQFRAAQRELKHLNSEEIDFLGALKASRALDPTGRKS